MYIIKKNISISHKKTTVIQGNYNIKEKDKKNTTKTKYNWVRSTL